MSKNGVLLFTCWADDKRHSSQLYLRRVSKGRDFHHKSVLAGFRLTLAGSFK